MAVPYPKEADPIKIFEKTNLRFVYHLLKSSQIKRENLLTLTKKTSSNQNRDCTQTNRSNILNSIDNISN